MLGMVRLNLYMGSMAGVWDPYTLDSIKRFENIQHRAARFVYKNYNSTDSVTNMIQKLGWLPLQE